MATALDPALNPDVFGMQPRLPTMPKPTPLGAAEERLAGTEKELGAALKQQAEFAGAQAERETRQAATKAKGEAEILGRQAEEMRAAEEPIRVAEEEKMKARFSPTRETATEMAALYSLVGVLGFAIGRGGKNNAMQAMSAMNGMLDGYRQGSVDRFNQEKKLFDSNLKSMTDNINMLTNRLQRIAQLSTVDKLKAEQELAVTLAEGNADFVKQNINKFGLPATIQYLKQVQTAAQRAVDKEREFERKAEQKARDAAEAREREKDRQAFLQKMQGERIGAQRDLQAERIESAQVKASNAAKNEKVPPKEVIAQNQLRNNIIPRLESAIPVLDRLNQEGKWNKMTLALAADPRAAEYLFRDDPEAIQLILTLSYFRSKEFETAGKALTKKEDQILAPIVRGDLRVYEGIKNAMREGLETAKKEQRGLETNYPYFKKFNTVMRGETGAGAETDIDTERKNAQAAIAAGKDESAVKARFKERTGQEL